MSDELIENMNELKRLCSENNFNIELYFMSPEPEMSVYAKIVDSKTGYVQFEESHPNILFLLGYCLKHMRSLNK